MTIDIRQASHPEAVRLYGTAELRRHYLVRDMFRPDGLSLTYSHHERFVIGGAMPVGAPLDLPCPKPLGTASFLDRREIGIFNIGGPGRVTVGSVTHGLAHRDALYAGLGAGAVSFASDDPARPGPRNSTSCPRRPTPPARPC